MDIQREITCENKTVREKLDLVAVEEQKIIKRRAVTERDIRRGRAEVGSQESSFTGNKLRADYLLLSSDELRLKWIEMMRKRPYFCRIDWNEKGGAPETYYIGRVGMCRSDDYSPIVVDWRAPIANLYYDGRLGFAEYSAPDGNFTGDLTLKRQLEIEDGTVRNLTDIDITTNDNLLQAALSKSADDRLKDIVVTIQAEQNRIIRDQPEGVLIVQGVAGSGKTTIILHRVAYLIYHSEGGKGLKTLIIAPNKLFLNYISNVLPELGVEDIQQDTFAGMAAKLLPPKVKVLPSHEMTEDEQTISVFKGSLEFKSIIDKYVEYLEEGMVPEGDFCVGGQTMLKAEEIRRIFRRDCQYLPLLKRHKEMEKRLNKRARAMADKAIEWKMIDTENRLINLRISNELTTELAHQIYNDRDWFVAHAEDEAKAAVKSYMKQWMADSTLNLYFRLIGDDELMMRLAGPSDTVAEVLNLVAQHAQEKLIPSGKISEDDLAGMAYLESSVGERREPESFDLIVVDEGQDLSEFQYFMLRQAARSGSFTIAGDLNQAIHAKGLNRWEMLQETVFDDLKVRYQTITKSYRTTVEVMHLANAIISRLGNEAALADPVLRHGSFPEYIKSGSMSDIVKDLAKRLPGLLEEGFASFGIICRDVAGAKEVYKALSTKVLPSVKEKLHLLLDTETEYKGGISILPAQLCKGLEFDVTVVVDAQTYGLTPKEIRLFYVTVTRALHKLFIFSIGDAPILEGVWEKAREVAGC